MQFEETNSIIPSLCFPSAVAAVVQEKEDIRWEETWYFKIQAGVEEEAKRVLQLLETGGSGNQADPDSR